MNLGVRLRRRRRECFYTVAELAAIVGCSLRALYSAEKNTNIPKLATLARLAKVLDITIDELVGDDYE